MHFFKRFILNGSTFWNWIGFTILPALLPFIMTIFSMIASPRQNATIDDYIKMSDLIFVGLTLTIANFYQLRAGIDEKIIDYVFATSMICMVLLCIILGVTNDDEPATVGMLFIVIALIFWVTHASYNIVKSKTTNVNQSNNHDSN